MERQLAEMKAAFREIDPRAGWEDDLRGQRAEILRGRPAFLMRERRELEELVPLCEDSATAEQVVDRLRRIGQESTSRLCDFVLADHRNRRVAFYAIAALAEINEPIARDAIIRACGHDEPWVRVGAVRALERVPDERRVGVLLTLLGDEQVQVRDASARALGNVGDVRAVRPLLAALDDPDESARINVAWALAALGDIRGLAVLTSLSASDDSLVRSICRDKLRSLGPVGPASGADG